MVEVQVGPPHFPSALPGLESSSVDDGANQTSPKLCSGSSNGATCLLTPRGKRSVDELLT